MRQKKTKITRKARVQTQQTKKVDLKKVGLLAAGIVLSLYIVFFLETRVWRGGLDWKNNFVSFNHTRTDVSYRKHQDKENKNTDYDQIENQYLSENSIVDPMQEKNIVRMANENRVRKKLTKASRGIQDSSTGYEEMPELAEKTTITEDKIILSITDYEVLQRIVEAEATGLDEKSKILVANVLLNRVRSSEFPNTVEEVVFQSVNGATQFQPVSDGRYEKVVIQEDTVEAVNKALSGVDYSQGALYFLARSGSRKSSITWFDNNLTWLFEYEGHEFFK